MDDILYILYPIHEFSSQIEKLRLCLHVIDVSLNRMPFASRFLYSLFGSCLLPTSSTLNKAPDQVLHRKSLPVFITQCDSGSVLERYLVIMSTSKRPRYRMGNRITERAQSPRS
jgi:hypothetical protein